MQKNIKIDLLTTIIFTLVLLMYIFTTIISVPILPTMGKYMFLAVMAPLFVLIIQRKFITTKEFKFFLPFILFTALYLINLNGLSDARGIMIVFNQLAYMMVIYIIFSINWTGIQIKILSNIFYITLPVLLLLIFVFPGTLNANKIGSFAFFLAFFPLLFLSGYTKNLKKSRIFLIFTLTILTMIATDARSIMLSAAFGSMTFIIWKFIAKKKILYNLYFLLIVSFNYFVVAIYPNLYKWEHFLTLNEWSIRLTDKPIMTGRNTIWAQLTDLISLNPWLGYGSNAVPEDFLTTSLSAHNLYLQIGLQVGLVGVFFLTLFFFLVWKKLWKNRYDTKVILAGSFFISIIIHQSFEVSLTQNQFGLGLLQWVIIGFGLSFALNKDIKAEP